MHGTEETREAYPDDVEVVDLGERQILLVGTAHVSQESAEIVRDVIRREKPDHVCVELDPQRYKALSQKTRWDNLDLKQIIRSKQLTTLLANLLLGTYQKRIGDQLGVLPGTELLEATRVAEECEIPFSLCDRNIRITMLRAWRSMSFLQKWKLLAAVTGSLFVDTEISEEELRKLRSKDALSEMMEELATGLPALKRVLIDERDAFLAQKIRSAEGRRIVAVVGAGHVEGIRRALVGGAPCDLEPLRAIPAVSPAWKWVGWGIPAVIVGSLLLLAWTQGAPVAGRNLLYWILANGIPSSLGAVIAMAHPLTILAAFVAAPITSLTPVIGAGYVTAFVQAYVQPPLVRDFQTLSDDAGSARKWWSNRLLRVLLAFVFPAIGSMIGTYVGGYEIISNLF